MRMLKAMYVIPFGLESLSLNIEDVLAGCGWFDAHVAYLLAQSVTVENLINRERKKKNAHKLHSWINTTILIN